MTLFMYIIKLFFAFLDLYASINMIGSAREQAQTQLKLTPVRLELHLSNFHRLSLRTLKT